MSGLSLDHRCLSLPFIWYIQTWNDVIWIRSCLLINNTRWRNLFNIPSLTTLDSYQVMFKPHQSCTRSLILLPASHRGILMMIGTTTVDECVLRTTQTSAACQKSKLPTEISTANSTWRSLIHLVGRYYPASARYENLSIVLLPIHQHIYQNDSVA